MDSTSHRPQLSRSVRDLARRRAPLVGLPRLRSSRPAAPLRGRALPLALAPSPGLAGGAGAGGRRTPCGVGRRGPCCCAATPRAVGESCRLPLNRTACAPRSLPRMLARRTFTPPPPPSNPQKMPKKRRNCGRNRHGRGHTRMVDCSHCMCKPAKVRRWERRGGCMSVGAPARRCHRLPQPCCGAPLLAHLRGAHLAPISLSFAPLSPSHPAGQGHRALHGPQHGGCGRPERPEGGVGV